MPAKKSNVARMPESGDNSSAIGAVAAAISSVGDEFGSIKYKIEEMTEAINHISVDAAIGDLADVVALSVIANRGTDEDREAAIAKLKKRFSDLDTEPK
jgi:hypothetical protein